jgi:hypothetical protein
MRSTRHPDAVPYLEYLRDTSRRLLLGGCLLVLMISGCTMGSPGHVSPHAPMESPSGVNQQAPRRADYGAAGDAYCNYSQPATAIAC